MITLLKMLPHPGKQRTVTPGGSTIGPAQPGERESAGLHLASAWEAAEPVRRMAPSSRKTVPTPVVAT
jgi:hypothetical protein